MQTETINQAHQEALDVLALQTTKRGVRRYGDDNLTSSLAVQSAWQLLSEYTKLKIAAVVRKESMHGSPLIANWLWVIEGGKH